MTELKDKRRTWVFNVCRGFRESLIDDHVSINKGENSSTNSGLLTHLWCNAHVVPQQIVLLVVAFLMINLDLRSFRHSLCFCGIFVLQFIIFKICEVLQSRLSSSKFVDTEGHPFVYKLLGIVDAVFRTQFQACQFFVSTKRENSTSTDFRHKTTLILHFPTTSSSGSTPKSPKCSRNVSIDTIFVVNYSS